MIFCPLPGRLWRKTQGFYDRPEYYKKYGLKAHGGIDLAPLVPGTRGVVVYAPHDGYVSLNDFGKKGYGRHAYITSEPFTREGQRRQSVLGHLESFLVKDGQFVSAGDPVGIMGNTGDSTNVHLHWAYRPLNANLEPIQKGNGFNGFIDVSAYTVYWSLSTLG